MRVVGVDLAAEAVRTGLAVIAWTPHSATLSHLQLGATDAEIVAAVGADAVVGIDCPLGWPDAFVDFVVRHASGDHPVVPVDRAGRQLLSNRATDVVVHDRIGRWPLSVATDRLGVTALRCAGLLAELAAAGVPVGRGAPRGGRLFEVYPGAALSLWGFDRKGYRVEPARRALLVDRLGEVAPWLDLGAAVPLMVASADAFDAVIAALVTRAAARGLFDGPPPELAAQASREGWAVLPDGDLADLVDATG